MSDEWVEAYSRLSMALEVAFSAGMTEEEIEECIENTRPSDKPYIPGSPKPKRPGPSKREVSEG